MAVLRLFAQAREAAGSARDTVDGATVDEVLAAAGARYGDGFAAVNNVSVDVADGDDPVTADDEVAVLPPVSGGGS